MCVHSTVCPREVEIASDMPLLGVCRPDADPRAWHGDAEHTNAWLMGAATGDLWGNGKEGDDAADDFFEQGDRMGVLLDLDDGSLLFFRNGAQHGPGYPAGSVAGAVALGVQMAARVGTQARLLPGAEWPAGHAP